jgi:hypothetical protein
MAEGTGSEAESKPEEGEVKKDAGRAAGGAVPKSGRASAGSTRLPVKASEALLEGEWASKALKSTVEVDSSVAEVGAGVWRAFAGIEGLWLTALNNDSPPREVKRLAFNLSADPSKPGLSSKRGAGSDPKSGESKSNATLVHCSSWA